MHNKLSGNERRKHKHGQRKHRDSWKEDENSTKQSRCLKRQVPNIRSVQKSRRY